MKLLIATDEKTPVSEAIVRMAKEMGYEVTLGGDFVDENIRWHWAEIARDVAKKVVSGEVDQAILFCWSGTGVCMAANKVPGARAALCWDSETAKLARKWDDANILCMSLRFTSETLAKEMLTTWFVTSFDEESLDQVKYLR